MFVDRLNGIADRVEGTTALVLVGRDGIPVESVCRDQDLDLEMLAAELVAQAQALAQYQDEFATGLLHQLMVTTERSQYIVSRINDGYYLLLVAGQHSNLGRARYELRRASLLFEEDLI